ncbi:hypothetical protein [Pyxidicoccus trucidator]|uniref:hypothetical protein n=1 Tax=Pyxidicoccus trucidator TaxID=2709662 RepID=UPI0013DD1746|nr:hypothetical protein [Pyxidicoccus trucidator]
MEKPQELPGREGIHSTESSVEFWARNQPAVHVRVFAPYDSKDSDPGARQVCCHCSSSEPIEVLDITVAANTTMIIYRSPTTTEPLHIVTGPGSLTLANAPADLLAQMKVIPTSARATSGSR